MVARKRSRRRGWTPPAWLAAALLLLAVALRPGAARAQDRGIQTTPDGNLMLVSKDINGERWSISLNLSDGTAIGNVFPSGGGAPSFVWCSSSNIALTADPTTTQYTLECYGASACSALPCPASGWTYLQQVQLSGSFFFAP
jgi:hypothetical protein